MQDYTVNVLIGYIYNRFALVFFICLLGSFVKDWSSTISELSEFNIKKIIASSLSSAIVICAVTEYIKVNFAVYVFICFMGGLWGYQILGLITNSYVVIRIIKFILGNRIKNIDELIDSIGESSDNEKDDKNEIEENGDSG